MVMFGAALWLMIGASQTPLSETTMTLQTQLAQIRYQMPQAPWQSAEAKTQTDPVILKKEISAWQKAGKRFIAEVSAYTSSPDETDGTPFITASGTSTRPGILACSRKYLFGTHWLINGRIFECQDRLNKRYEDAPFPVFDIWVQSKQEAFNFGRQYLWVLPINPNLL